MTGALILVALGGCTGTAAPASPTPTLDTPSVRPSTPTVATASPPSVAAPSGGSPTPTQPAVGHSPSSSVSPTALFSWLPPIDAGVEPAFDVDEFVIAAADLVPVSVGPGETPYPGQGYGRGFRLVVLHGPVVVDGIQWYLLTPAYIPIDIPTAWAPATSPDGTALFASDAFACPMPPLTQDELGALGLADGLPACYGTSEITIDGQLTCDSEPDPWVTGATWLAGGTCRLPSTPTVYGLDAGLPRGRYSISGHFDDPEAAKCRDGMGATSEQDRLMAILVCRRGFVAREAVPVQ